MTVRCSRGRPIAADGSCCDAHTWPPCCRACGEQLTPEQAEAGLTVHPVCPAEDGREPWWQR